jgi:RNA polymerase sigma factor (sigma-70 family)
MAKDNKQERFEREFMPHVEALHTFGYHLTYNDEDAADLVQETYLKAFKFIDKFEDGTNSKAWLFKIMKNAYINDYRKRAKRPTQVDHDGDDPQLSSYYDIREDLFDNVMGDEITAAINSIPDDFKTVIFLCDIEEFSYEEIAKILEIPIGTVRSRLFRARNMLKELLKNYAEKMGFKDHRGEKNNSTQEDE